MQERKEFNPKQLSSARIAKGMTMKDLAEESGLSRQMISNYESGKTKPKADSLLRIISVLNFPKNFFMEEMPDLHNGPVYFRSQSAATKRTRDMQKERLKYCYEVFKILARYVNFPEVKLPSLLEKDVHEISEGEIINKAEELRRLWNIDSISPVQNLIQIAEKNGIIISEANMSDKSLDAVSRWIIDRPFIMLTDNNESSVRRRFNVAHEIGHIILHNSIESIHDYSSQELKNVIERQANLFASHFLLPSEAFSDSLMSTSLDYYIELKKYWKVSIQAMIYKTYSMGLINDDQRLYLNKKISRNKWRTREPYDDEIPVERPTLIKKVYEMIVKNDVLPQNELNYLFRLPREEVEKIIGRSISGSNKLDEQKPILRLLENN